MRRFVVVSDIVNVGDMGKITDIFKSKGFGWARYFSGAWLLSVPNSTVTPTELCKEIIATVPGKDVMVLEIPGSPGWAFSMSDAELTKNLKSWLGEWGR
jgi:hypothetical protein